MYSIAHFSSHIRRAKIKLLLDVGANEGQFASNALGSGYKGHLISFEPLSDAHARLVVAAKENPRWEVAPRCALGASEYHTTINIAANSYSSSLRPMLDALLNAAPQSAYTGSEQVSVITLAGFLEGRFPGGVPPFAMKIDTQGFEAEVLDGLGKHIEQCAVLLIEVPLDNLYEGAADLPTLYTRLQKSGFHCVGMSPGYQDPKSRDVIEVDGVFVRDRTLKKSDEFPLYTSIGPRLSDEGLQKQREIIASWREAGFTPISVNGPRECREVNTLNLDIEVEQLSSDGKPIIGEIISAIVKRGSAFAGIINSDCSILCYPNLALILQTQLEGSMYYVERIDTLGGHPITHGCGSFDAFFFDTKAVKGIQDNYYKLGETWWDYWFPLRAMENGTKLGIISQPLLLHERHDARWNHEAWFRSADHFYRDFKTWANLSRFPKEIFKKIDSLSTEKTAFGVAAQIFVWLRSQNSASTLRVLPPEFWFLEQLGISLKSAREYMGKPNLNIEHIRSELDKEHTAFLEHIYSSISWNVTAPLRHVVKFTRRYLRK